MRQLPVRAKIVEPANLGTVDCDFFCFCDDGSDYAVKGTTKGRYIPHSEWFCKHLGDAVGIPSPECRLVEVGQSVLFGSRWESVHDPREWPTRLQSDAVSRERAAPALSRIFAFDLFVNNVDRHTNNYIVRQQRGGWSFLAFDHSRAWMASGWPLPDPPMDALETTRKNARIVNEMLGGIIQKCDVDFVLDRLNEVRLAYIEDIINCQHGSWLNVSEKDAILNFWASSAVGRRLEMIREGFRVGTYI